MSRPNILLLLSDSQQAMTVDPSSPCHTPNIDRLSGDGTRFTRCYTANPICSPSRASLMTGVLPHSHGVVANTHVVEPYRASFQDDLETWGERIADEGYHTGYFGKWHVERTEDPGSYGFAVTDDDTESYTEFRERRGLDPRPDYSPENLVRSRTVHQDGYGEKMLYGTHTEPEGTRAAFRYSQGVDFVEDVADDDDPWCLTVSTGAPHDPFLAPAEVYEQYDPDDIEKPPNFGDQMADKPDVYQRIPEVWEDLEWREFAEAIAHYYAYCTHVDQQVGRILDALEETGQREDTVVVFASDHGDMMGGHRMFTHGYTAFEEVYNSPLVVDWPGVGDGGQTCDELVQLHDVAPTLVDVAGGGEFPPESNTRARHQRAPTEEGYDSYCATSLVPFLRGERPEDHRREAYAEYDGDSFGTSHRVYWSGRYKYVLNMYAKDELYDLEEDPGETMNLAGDPRYEETMEEMAARVWEIARDTNDRTISENNYWMYRIAPVGPYADD